MQTMNNTIGITWKVWRKCEKHISMSMDNCSNCSDWIFESFCYLYQIDKSMAIHIWKSAPSIAIDKHLSLLFVAWSLFFFYMFLSNSILEIWLNKALFVWLTVSSSNVRANFSFNFTHFPHLLNLIAFLALIWFSFLLQTLLK